MKSTQSIIYYQIEAVEVWEYEATRIGEVSEEEYAEMICEAFPLGMPDFPDHIENIRGLFIEEGLDIYAKQENGEDKYFGFRLEGETEIDDIAGEALART